MIRDEAGQHCVISKPADDRLGAVCSGAVGSVKAIQHGAEHITLGAPALMVMETELESPTLTSCVQPARMLQVMIRVGFRVRVRG